MASREIFRRPQLSGTEAHHAHARPAHRVRERALPQHGRMLGASHRHLHDPRQYLHARVRLLRRAERQAARSAGRRRARARRRSRRAHGLALRRGHFRESRRSARRRRRNFRAHDLPDSRARSRMQSGSPHPRFSRRLVRAGNSNGSASRRAESQHGNRAAPLPPRPQRRSLRALARAAAPRRRNGARPRRQKPE